MKYIGLFGYLSKSRLPSRSWISIKEIRRFAKVIIWLSRLDEFKAPIYLLSERIAKLWSKSGPSFTFLYLKECLLIVVRFLSGRPDNSFRKIRVARDHRMLPSILPLEIRKFLDHERSSGFPSQVRVAGILSLLSLFRVMPTKVKPSLDTILDGFSGLARTFDRDIIRRSLLALTGNLPSNNFQFKLIGGESAGPNGAKSAWMSGVDALAFIHSPKQAYYLLSWFWTHGARWYALWFVVLLTFGFPVWLLLTISGTLPRLELGRLSVVYDQAGKARVVAITNWWIQFALYPLHRAIFSFLKKVECDGTFDQDGCLAKLIAKPHLTGQTFHSFDLSAATDRLPIDLQVSILELFIGSSAQTWKALLDFDWFWRGRRIRYAVGQPMGAYSSWAMLALSHHVIVQMAAIKAGFSSFSDYCVLGDDIVIANDAVAREYLALMETLGVDINLTKSVISSDFAEFAKRWRGPNVDITPIGPGLVLRSIRSRFYFGALLAETIKLRWISPQSVVALLKRLPFHDWNSKRFEALWMVFGPGSWSMIPLQRDVSETIRWCFKGIDRPGYLVTSLWTAAMQLRLEELRRNFKLEDEAKDHFFRNAFNTFASRSLSMRLLEAWLKFVSPGFWFYLRRIYDRDTSTRDLQIKEVLLSPVSYESAKNLLDSMPSIDVSSINWDDSSKLKNASSLLKDLRSKIIASHNRGARGPRLR